MKRIVLGCAVALSLIAFACGGGGGGGTGPECTKYLACAKKIGGTTATTAESTFGSGSSCAASTATTAACESSCTAGLPGLETSIMAADGGTCK